MPDVSVVLGGDARARQGQRVELYEHEPGRDEGPGGPDGGGQQLVGAAVGRRAELRQLLAQGVVEGLQ